MRADRRATGPDLDRVGAAVDRCGGSRRLDDVKGPRPRRPPGRHCSKALRTAPARRRGHLPGLRAERPSTRQWAARAAHRSPLRREAEAVREARLVCGP